MLAFDIKKNIKTFKEFEKIMNCNKKLQMVVLDNDDNFVMILNPKSDRFNDCYSVAMVPVDENTPNKGMILRHVNIVSTDDIIEFHNDKKSANFKGLWEDIIEYEGGICKVFITNHVFDVIKI